MKAVLLTCTIVFSGIIVFAAGELSPENKEALEKTQALMRDKNARQASVAKDPKHRQADEFVRKLSNGNEEITDEIYDLAADVFANLVKDTNGNTQSMDKLVEQFRRDPSSFVNGWSPEQKSKLKSLAEKIGNPGISPP